MDTSKLLRYRRKLILGWISAVGCLLVAAISNHFNVKALVWIFGGGFVFEVLSLLIFIRSYRRRWPKCPECEEPLKNLRAKDQLVLGTCPECGTDFELGSSVS